ncbi:polysaccharide deacetylase family protein [Salinithrix halophila]|uniref:Polysaccharide deacetylase family protein n=1 Tax=Salinithrix halophila TaxID=1485204 RepID=A0ABV8JFS8_9BACL
MWEWREINVGIKCSLTILLSVGILAGCYPLTKAEPGTPAEQDHATGPRAEEPLHEKERPAGPSRREIRKVIQANRNQRPSQWGEDVPGVKHRLKTTEKVAALTFDACGGPKGSGYDWALIRFLKRENIPATLFVNSRWIDENPELFRELAKEPLFEIENHGTRHRPLSVTGRSVYGIAGTANLEKAVEEVIANQQKIAEKTGKLPHFFRSGTAYYDEVAVKAAKKLGVEIVNYDVLGDAGATWSRAQVKQALLDLQPGSIVLLHMNQPGSGTAGGVQDAVPRLRERGYRFVKLEDYELE